MANNKFIFAIIICFFTIAAIPAKTSLQTPILSKIYAIILKKIILTPLVYYFLIALLSEDLASYFLGRLRIFLDNETKDHLGQFLHPL